ncbi:MAG TPA: hypothetical protein VLV89_05015 [Candidatus Acidoferrum sp.]|nr:hypothetical protein [Candidatus Acidoferrum sp.]
MDPHHSYEILPAAAIRPVFSLAAAGFYWVRELLAMFAFFVVVFGSVAIVVLLVLFLKYSGLKGISYFQMGLSRFRAGVTPISAHPRPVAGLRSTHWN